MNKNVRDEGRTRGFFGQRLTRLNKRAPVDAWLPCGGRGTNKTAAGVFYAAYTRSNNDDGPNHGRIEKRNDTKFRVAINTWRRIVFSKWKILRTVHVGVERITKTIRWKKIKHEADQKRRRRRRPKKKPTKFVGKMRATVVQGCFPGTLIRNSNARICAAAPDGMRPKYPRRA